MAAPSCVLGNMNVISVAVYPTLNLCLGLKPEAESGTFACAIFPEKQSHMLRHERTARLPLQLPHTAEFQKCLCSPKWAARTKREEERERSLAVCWFRPLCPSPTSFLLTDVFAELLSAFLAYSLAHSSGSCFPASIANVWIKRKITFSKLSNFLVSVCFLKCCIFF